MHSLDVLKSACQSAMDPDDETPGDLALFHAVVDPGSVLELIELVERAGVAVAAEREACAKILRSLLDRAYSVQDRGPEGEGWKSDALEAEILAAENYLKSIEGL